MLSDYSCEGAFRQALAAELPNKLAGLMVHQLPEGPWALIRKGAIAYYYAEGERAAIEHAVVKVAELVCQNKSLFKLEVYDHCIGVMAEATAKKARRR